MGAQKQHPNNSELFYYIAYLIYDSKVVSKIGIYETDKRLSSMTHRTMNFALHDLLIDSHYSKNPNALMAFINKSLNKPKNKGKEGEEEKIQGKEDELEEGELEEGEVSNESKQLNTIQSWLKDKVKTIKNPSVTRVFNILRQFKKNKTDANADVDINLDLDDDINTNNLDVNIYRHDTREDCDCVNKKIYICIFSAIFLIMFSILIWFMSTLFPE